MLLLFLSFLSALLTVPRHVVTENVFFGAQRGQHWIGRIHQRFRDHNQYIIDSPHTKTLYSTYYY